MILNSETVSSFGESNRALAICYFYLKHADQIRKKPHCPKIVTNSKLSHFQSLLIFP